MSTTESLNNPCDMPLPYFSYISKINIIIYFVLLKLNKPKSFLTHFLDSFEMFCDGLHDISKKGVKNDFGLFSLSKTK